IKGRLIPALAKIDARLVIRARLVFLALELVPAIVVGIIDHLEGTVMLDSPYDLLAQKRSNDLGGEMIVVLWRQPVADVMQDGGSHPVDVGTFAKGTGRRLETMFEAGDLVARKGFLWLEPKLAQDTVGRALDMFEFKLAKEQVLLPRPMLHFGRFDGLHQR